MHNTDHEALVKKLADPTELQKFRSVCLDFRPSFTARVLGKFLVGAGNLFYGRAPSYEKFKAIEVIARVPYQSWESVAYTWLTAYYADEHHAMRLAKILPVARDAQDNETMHVVVLSQLVREQGMAGFILHTFVPIVFSFFYYWAVWVLSFFNTRTAFELNYLFEAHAFAQYSEFLEHEGERLKARPLVSAYLRFYGREAKNEFEFFNSVRIDEAIHEYQSVMLAREITHRSIM